MPEVINHFDGPYRWLSNFHRSPIWLKGLLFNSVENAYQAMKSADPADWTAFTDPAMTPSRSKWAGRKLKLRPGWDDPALPPEEQLRAIVMRHCVKLKFKYHPDLAAKLLATEDALLVEGTTWHDTFFGVCTCEKHKGKGLNMLGRILMDTREELRNASQEQAT